MRNKLEKLLVGAAVVALAVPAVAQADEQALQKRVDELTRKVEKLEDKSLSKWLTIGGDYRFRLDSLNGSTKAYTDAFGSLTNAQNALQGTIFGGGSIAGQPLSQLMPLVQTMQGTTSYAAAAGMVGGLMSPLPPGTPANIVLQQQMAGLLMTPTAFGGYAKQVPAYKPNNDTLYTNRVGLNLHAKATKDVSVNVRLLAYKTFGASDDQAVTNGGATPFFADRVGVFDGTQGRVPSSDFLNVDRAFATWSNIGDQPVWFSIGRRPSTEGAPSNLRLNNERPGNGGTPALLVDYAFDGMTIGYAPDIEALPGAYTKLCYGRGFEAGYETTTNNLKDTDMLGLAIIPVDTDPLRVWLQYNRGFNIFDFPAMTGTAFGDTAPAVNLGAIDWYGLGAMSTLKKVGPGNLNFFGDVGMSVTHPNDSVSGNAGFQGLMTGGFFNPEAPSSKTGWATYVGARYDYEPSKTKLGLEYNHGSKNWITFAPAADDMWTSKVGTRGDVYEAYIIQELDSKAVSSYLSKAFFRIGFQYYDFEYTGSNNWVGAPVKISSIQPTDMMLMAPVKSARDIYATLEVKF